MQNDVLCYLDKGFTVALVILDISAAFDTVCHEKLIECFRKDFGISGIALNFGISGICRLPMHGTLNKQVCSRLMLCSVPPCLIKGPITSLMNE